MTENKTPKKLELIHVLYIMAGVLLAVGIAWGTVINEQKNHKEQINKKLNQDIFQQHQEQQIRSNNDTKEMIQQGFQTINKRFDKLEEK